MPDRVLTVSELTNLIKAMIDGEPLLRQICVSGELSNYKVYPSGHHYFTIKDEEATLKAVMFRGNASHLRFKPENGMKVLAFGRISVYPRDGAYQLYADRLTPEGIGDLYAAYEQLKQKLSAEGLFRPEHKKPIPEFPERIVLITSPAGAAVRDMIRILLRRFPIAKLLILPVRVQGQEAPPEIADAIRYANRWDLGDVLITGRGGGSIEDLWAFNDERVARAIYDSRIPVISAVGHEPDVTISDFVADLRAATPSNAAELAVPDREELQAGLSEDRKRLTLALLNAVRKRRNALDAFRERPVLEDASGLFADRRLRLDHASERLLGAQTAQLTQSRTRLVGAASALDAMSPLKVLSRGYAVARTENGSVIRSADTLRTGDRVNLMFADGSVPCEVLSEPDRNRSV